jgi:hypothetical protein
VVTDDDAERTAEAAAAVLAKTTKTRARRGAGGADATTAICTRTTAPWRAHSSRTSLRAAGPRVSCVVQSALRRRQAARFVSARFKAGVQLVWRREVIQHQHRRRSGGGGLRNG